MSTHRDIEELVAVSDPVTDEDYDNAIKALINQPDLDAIDQGQESSPRRAIIAQYLYWFYQGALEANGNADNFGGEAESWKEIAENFNRQNDLRDRGHLDGHSVLRICRALEGQRTLNYAVLGYGAAVRRWKWKWDTYSERWRDHFREFFTNHRNGKHQRNKARNEIRLADECGRASN